MAEETTDSSTEKTGLKPASIVASALAAVTAAFLGSTLGVGGTVAGAGIASVVTTVGGEVYLRSLRRTRAAARKTAEVLALTDTRLRQETTFVEPPPRRPGNPLMQPVPPTRGRLPATQLNRIQRTTRIPMAGHGASGSGERTVYLPRQPVQRRPGLIRATPPGADAPTRFIAPPEQAGPSEQDQPESKKPWWKNRWTLIAGSSAVAFVVGMLAITGFESITGHAVSGGQGTTFGQVVRGSSTGGGSTTTTGQSTTVTRTQTSTATPTESSMPVTGPSSASSTPTSLTPAPTSASVAKQSASAQPTESAAPSSG
ncbi:MAG TPA: hypothetical protein VJ870_02860 [Amycolatopsis sp.]|nr:hypothetical protein [Amycolatopsis sp.]